MPISIDTPMGGSSLPPSPAFPYIAKSPYTHNFYIITDARDDNGLPELFGVCVDTLTGGQWMPAQNLVPYYGPVTLQTVHHLED